MKIMVVDDEKLFTEFLIENLKEIGFIDITSAGSGPEALRIIASDPDPFDCFLLDIKMPEMDGIQLCSEIRELPEYRAAPIIMITSADARTHMQDAFEAGATDYLAKPIEIMELRIRIQVAMLLVEMLRSEAESRSALRTLLKTSPDGSEFSLAMRATFSQVPSMRDYFQLENRLLRLGEGIYPMTLLSIEINGIKNLAARLDQNEFLSIIHSVSRILGKTLPLRGTTLSYVGYGKFICLVVIRNQIVPNLLQARIRDSFAAFIARNKLIDCAELQLNVSALSQKRMFTAEDAIGLSRRYIGVLGATKDIVLPRISRTQNRLFGTLK